MTKRRTSPGNRAVIEFMIGSFSLAVVSTRDSVALGHIYLRKFYPETTAGSDN